MNIYQIDNWRFINQSRLGPSFGPLQSFAIDDTLCTSVGASDSLPTVRTWVHQQTVVLGIQDSRLPAIGSGINFLNDKGFQTIIRNSGGLAVVLDEGILNISLIFKEDKQLTIDSGYKAMVELIQAMFESETSRIEAREISGSYCPGRYDLSIGGKKFAGISQRRIRGGVAVQIYLCVNGSGSSRALVIKDFYHEAVGNSETKFQYPKIVPATMASLAELLDMKLDIADVIARLLIVLKSNGNAKLETSELNQSEQLLFDKNYERILKRQLD